MKAFIMYLYYAMIFVAFFINGKAMGQCSANFTHSPDQECADTPIFFDASSSTGAGLTYTWDFNDGSAIISTTEDTITHKFHAFNDENCGIKERFLVQLTITDSTGCTDNLVRTVTVVPQPLAALLDSMDNNWIICLDPLDPVFGDTLWVNDWVPFEHCVSYFNIDWGDGSDTTNLNINSFPLYHVYTSTGIFQMNYYVHGVHACHWDTNYQVIVQTFPTASLDVTPVGPGCAPFTVDIIIDDYQGNWQEAVYTLDFGDGSPPLQWNAAQSTQYDTIQYTYTQSHCDNPLAGILGYRVSLQINDNNLCGDTTIYSQFIEVLEAPQASFQANMDSICINETICFTNNSIVGFSSGCSQNTSYVWDFGDGVISEDVSPCHSYVTPGAYQVKLTAFSSSICFHDTSMMVYVFNDPTASILVDEEICFRDTMFFYDNSQPGSGEVIVWTWDFGDGNSSSSSHPQHVYGAPGTYEVTLQVENTFGCIDDTTMTVEIFRLPSADFSDSTHCNFTTYFTDLSSHNAGGMEAWSWDFGDGSTAAVQHPVHNYNTFGNYQVILTVTNANGCKDVIGKNVIVHPVPIADFANDTACAATAMQFTDLSQCDHGNIMLWNWDFGDGGTSNLQHPDHSFSQPGIYLVSLTITSSVGCKDSTAGLVWVDALPVAAFAAPVSCDVDTVHFTDLSFPNASSITNWFWDFGDGYVSYEQHPVHKYALPGSYLVYQRVENSNGCVDDTLVVLDILSTPLASFYHSSPVCKGELVYFHDGSVAGLDTIVSWEWSFGDGTFSADQHPVHLFENSGMHNVRLIVTNANGCTSEYIQELPVAEYPIPDFAVELPCWINITKFIDLSYNPGLGNITDWYWDFGDGYTSVYENPDHKYAYPGQYEVSLTVFNEFGCSGSINKTVQIYDGPRADFHADTLCLDSEVPFTDLSTPGGEIVSWFWDFNDPASGNQNYSTAQNPYHTFTLEGFYNISLTVTDFRGCQHTSTIEYYAEPNPTAAFNYEGTNCPYGEIFFYDLSNTSHSELSMWIWDFGDGDMQTINGPGNPNVSHVYTAGGYYQVTLMVYTLSGCYDIYTDQVFIMPAPDGNFYFENTCLGEETNFYDITLSPDIVSWNWNFGDTASGFSNYSVMQDPVHEFSATGTYTVTLIVGNAVGCLDTVFKSVTVTPIPPSDFYWDAACEDQTTYFYTDTTVVNINTIINYLWDFGDGTYSYYHNPGHIYGAEGIYTVTLTLTDSLQCESVISKEVEVYKKPHAFYDISEPTCLADTTFFDDLSSTTVGYITRWIWDYDDGSDPDTIYFPDDPNTYHIYPQAGLYVPVLKVTNDKGCSETYAQEVLVRPAPVAEYVYSYPCGGWPVQFTDMSIHNGQGEPSAYHWNFGDPESGAYNISSLQNPEHTFLFGDSTYIVSLIIENIFGCSDTIIKSIYVNEGPEIDFFWTNACEDGQTTFYPDTAMINIGLVSSCVWDFGDGTYAYNPVVTHTYDLPGVYLVNLTLEDTSACPGTLTKIVEVSPAPEAYFSTPEVNCENVPVFFDENSTSQISFITSWHYDFGDGSDTTILLPGIPDVYHVYTQTGNYTVSLSVTSADSCYDMYEQSISVDGIPTADFSWDGICEAIDYTFNDQSFSSYGSAITAWYWDFGDPLSGDDNFSELQNPLHNFSGPGTYVVSLEVTDAKGCTDVVENTVIVSDGPAVDFSFSSNCEGAPTNFMVDTAQSNTNAIAVYHWDFGDGSPASNLMNPSHVYVQSGTYEVILTVSDVYGCDTEISHDVPVTQSPVALFESEAGCAEMPTQFLDISYNLGIGVISQWYWDFNDPGSGTSNYSQLQNPTHTFTGAGVFDVSLTVTNSFGCSNSIQIPVSVFQKPEAAFSTYINPCNGGTAYFFDESTANAQIVAWEWEFENGYHSNFQNPIHTFSLLNATHPVRLTVTDSRGCIDTLIKQVFVPAELDVAIVEENNCMQKEVVFSAEVIAPQSSILTTYDWNFGDPGSGSSNISTLAEPVHVYEWPGTYHVTLEVQDANGCTAMISKEVNVYNVTQPAFSFDLLPCDSIVYFHDQTMNNGQQIDCWVWDFGDGSPLKIVSAETGSGDVVHEYDELGTYEVTLAVRTDHGCIDSISHQVANEACLNASFIAAEANCQYDKVVFSDSSSLEEIIEAWKWSFGDGRDTIYTQPSASITHTYNQSGLFNVRLVIEAVINGNYISDTMEHLVEVMPAPNTDFLHDPPCAGIIMNFTDISSTNGVPILSWNWDFGTGIAGDTSVYPDPEFAYSHSGYYQVSLITENIIGCKNTKTKDLLIYSSPEASFNNSLPCAGKPVNFIDLSSGLDSEIIAWTWDFGYEGGLPNTSSLQHPAWSFKGSGDRVISLEVVNEAGCKDQMQKEIDIYPSPQANFNIWIDYNNIHGLVLFEDLSEGADFCNWQMGDGMYYEQVTGNIEHYYDYESNFPVQQVAWNEYGCADTLLRDCDYINKALYVPNALIPEGINPETRLFTPKGRNLLHYHISVYNTWGEMLWESTALDDSGSPLESWDGMHEGSMVPSDVYIWKVEAMFKDGTVWDGVSPGETKNLSGSTSGPVVVVR